MCGRFALTSDMETLLYRFSAIVQPDLDLLPRYNIAPTQEVISIVSDGTHNRLGNLRWGLIPFWAKNRAIGRKMINARSETLHEKPSFSQLLTSKRCLVLANGFYEWKRENNEKQPMYIKAQDDQPMAFAGLWDKCQHPSGEVLSSCTIITTTPNRLMEAIHNRMPVILNKDSEQLWLDTSISDHEVLQPLLVPCADRYLEAYKVSNMVNNPRNESPECQRRVH